MGKIIFDNQEVTFEQIREDKWPKITSPYFLSALQFCKEWLDGEEWFTLHTSGSTGIPKPISVQRIFMERSSVATGNFFGIPKEAKLLCCLNTAMIAGKMMLVRGMEWDSTLYLEEPSGAPLSKFSPDQLFDFVAMVPAQVENSLRNEADKKKLDKISHLIIGGAPISPDLQILIAESTGKAYQTYGMTETVSHVALANINAQVPLIYQALPGVHFTETEDNRLIIHAPMAPASIVTNDIVILHSPEKFTWQGRADFTINSGGLKIQPEGVENQIAPLMAGHFPGSRYFIAGSPSEKWGEEVVLVIESTLPSSISTEKILGEIKRELDKYKSPKKIFYLENFLETPSGKIKRKENLKIALETYNH